MLGGCHGLRYFSRTHALDEADYNVFFTFLNWFDQSISYINVITDDSMEDGFDFDKFYFCFSAVLALNCFTGTQINVIKPNLLSLLTVFVN